MESLKSVLKKVKCPVHKKYAKIEDLSGHIKCSDFCCEKLEQLVQKKTDDYWIKKITSTSQLLSE